ncbi:MAG TPA: hypothetical protein DEO65_06540 [Bacillus bacterium]|nr:hypothetical protein [Bacillus sp. (in: firmicutes)]
MDQGTRYKTWTCMILLGHVVMLCKVERSLIRLLSREGTITGRAGMVTDLGDIIYCREINTIWNDILYRKIENASTFRLMNMLLHLEI